ncbi:hypothetical protein L6E12_28825 [Actinokineospora sp. PR83]|uniref:hypothetical protein n=1 Tax=Actinokineospora sp. PR83 TaxID=2884908 RepID=UPI001F1D40D0|nr:hypothetical protein [Actinokineospora sp. PR83]MCG8919785.1 hypothetical protein [Actinokineospora sp. PR83]
MSEAGGQHSHYRATGADDGESSRLRSAERGLRAARTIMCVQAVATSGIWVVQLLKVISRLDHNQNVPFEVWAVVVLNPVIAVVVAVAAKFLLSRPSARSAGVVVELVGCGGAVISVVTGYYQAVVAFALAVVVIVLIRKYEAAVFFRPPLAG